jgi:hypothetical protein
MSRDNRVVELQSHPHTSFIRAIHVARAAAFRKCAAIRVVIPA